MGLESAFRGMENANPNQDSNLPQLTAGKYKVKVTKVKAFESKNPKSLGKIFTVAEFEILSSSSADRPVGMTCSWLVDMGGYYGRGNLAAFIASCNGISPNDVAKVNAEVTTPVTMMCVGEQNPLAGSELCCEVVLINTKEHPAPEPPSFGKHVWSPV